MSLTYLIVRSRASYASFSEFCTTNSGAGRLIAARGAHQLCALEAGSAVYHTWIAAWRNEAEARTAYSNLDLSQLALPAPPQVLLVPGVPLEGLPGELSHLPVRANSKIPAYQPPTLMLIEGTAEEHPRLGDYLESILPMLRAAHAVYDVYTGSEAIEVLSGEWHDTFLALSRWPQAHQTQGFWLSDAYQENSIPLRIDIGRFSVVTLEAHADSYSGET